MTLDYILQVSSDLTFLDEMASRCGFDWWVEGTTLYFKKPAAGNTVQMTLETPQLLCKGLGADAWHRRGLWLGTTTNSKASPVLPVPPRCQPAQTSPM